MEGEWSCLSGGHFNGRRMVILEVARSLEHGRVAGCLQK